MTDTYHHGEKTEPVHHWYMNTCKDNLIDCSPSKEGGTKDWEEAYNKLSLWIEGGSLVIFYNSMKNIRESRERTLRLEQELGADSQRVIDQKKRLAEIEVRMLPVIKKYGISGLM